MNWMKKINRKWKNFTFLSIDGVGRQIFGNSLKNITVSHQWEDFTDIQTGISSTHQRWRWQLKQLILIGRSDEEVQWPPDGGCQSSLERNSIFKKINKKNKNSSRFQTKVKENSAETVKCCPLWSRDLAFHLPLRQVKLFKEDWFFLKIK